MIKLRKIKQTDSLYFAKWWQNVEIMNLFDPDASIPNDRTAKRRVTALIKNVKDIYYVITNEDSPIGYIYLHKRKHNWFELRILIGEKQFWNKGYGTLAIKILLKYALANGIDKIFVKVSTDNTHALNVLKNSGFTVVDESPDNGIRMELLPHSIRRVLKRVSSAKRVIEIAGPSPDGYRLYDDLRIAMPSIHITNKFNPVIINPSSGYGQQINVEEKVNAAKLPYALGSVDAYFTSYLSVITDFVNGKFLMLYPHWLDKILLDRAYREYDKSTRLIFNLRGKFFCQAMRTLKPGGIIVFVGPAPKDYILAERAGLNVLVRNYTASDGSETAIYQKSPRQSSI